ncbi:MAG: TIGR00725 family protein [Deltaproteobacteria bacterium]|nr:TIGR00725 family protein [Deltaproteobacteria bacterium]MBW2051947.1 TIGR00725 family protein [Deltaproteobacteria bacterium]MBW2139902.1 TIGR00725 family protein [Deltaproteobacteria bacterium]MBW2323079.1 TIGR00725 family protein [Deltaproteobacteria bacterium]
MVAVCGAGTCSPDVSELARKTGELLARHGANLICGGLGGVMAAAAQGAKAAGGLTIGILPGTDRQDANPFIDLALPTGLGEARNALIVRAAQAVIALPGETGTLSEVALGLKMGRPVVGLAAWGEINGVLPASDPDEAVRLALSRV